MVLSHLSEIWHTPPFSLKLYVNLFYWKNKSVQFDLRVEIKMLGRELFLLRWAFLNIDLVTKIMNKIGACREHKHHRSLRLDFLCFAWFSVLTQLWIYAFNSVTFLHWSMGLIDMKRCPVQSLVLKSSRSTVLAKPDLFNLFLIRPLVRLNKCFKK